MPGEVIDRPNPQPLPSQLPDYLEDLQINLSHEALDQKACDALFKFRRAACYIAAGKCTIQLAYYVVQGLIVTAMIFLKDNTLLKRDLTFDDIKPRLLGELNLVYSSL